MEPETEESPLFSRNHRVREVLRRIHEFCHFFQGFETSLFLPTEHKDEREGRNLTLHFDVSKRTSGAELPDLTPRR